MEQLEDRGQSQVYRVEIYEVKFKCAQLEHLNHCDPIQIRDFGV